MPTFEVSRWWTSSSLRLWSRTHWLGWDTLPFIYGHVETWQIHTKHASSYHLWSLCFLWLLWCRFSSWQWAVTPLSGIHFIKGTLIGVSTLFILFLSSSVIVCSQCNAFTKCDLWRSLAHKSSYFFAHSSSDRIVVSSLSLTRWSWAVHLEKIVLYSHYCRVFVPFGRVKRLAQSTDSPDNTIDRVMEWPNGIYGTEEVIQIQRYR